MAVSPGSATLTVVGPVAIAGGVGLYEQGRPYDLAAGRSVGSPAGAAARVPSDTCSWDALCIPYVEDPASREALDLGDGWSRTWSAEWRINGAELVCPARDLASMPGSRAAPMRHFSFATAQRHRPGLEYVTNTRAMHGFESMEEQKGCSRSISPRNWSGCSPSRFGSSIGLQGGR